MDFNPIFIEDVLTISKDSLETINRSEGIRLVVRKKLKDNQYVENNYSYTLWDSVGSRGNLNLKLELELLNSDHNFDANVAFNIANHSVKYHEVHQKRFERCRRSYQEWSANLCSFADALNPNKSFIVDGMLTIHIQAMIYKKPSEGEEKSCTNLGKFLWNRSDDRDFVIFVGAKDGPKTEVKIHKLILASRSPVFDRMLKTDMKEKAENRLEIIDFNVEVVQAAVEYFYDRDTFKSLNVENLVDLLFFSDKYDIADLKAKIEPLFLSKIYPDTIVRIANASNMLNLPELTELCIKSLNLYLNQNVQFDDAETLDEEIQKKLVYDNGH